MAWHSFLTRKNKQKDLQRQAEEEFKKRNENLKENLQNLRGDENE